MDVPFQTSDDSNNHLTTEALTSYINYFDQLAQYETEHISSHLATCNECRILYEEIFDRILNNSHNKHSLSLFNNSLSSTESDEVTFEDISNNFRLTIYKNDAKEFILIFNLIPHSVHNNMIGITIHELHKTFRFLNVDVKKEYKIDLPVETSISSITEIAVDILITTSRTTLPQKAEHRFTLVTFISLLFICGVLIFALIYFFSNKDENNNNEVILMSHTRKEMIEPEKYNKQKNENENISQPSDSALSSEFDSTAIADSLFNINPEDVYVQNDYSSNYILDKNVNVIDASGRGVKIISPKTNDTLSNSIKLRWIDTEKNRAYRINITDNKNHIMYETSIRGNDLIYSGKIETRTLLLEYSC